MEIEMALNRIRISRSLLILIIILVLFAGCLTIQPSSQNSTAIQNPNESLNSGSTTHVVAISAGFEHILALKNDGTVDAWCYKGGKIVCDVPSNLSDVSAVAAGAQYSLALKRDGTIVFWGFPDADNQLPTLMNLSKTVNISAISTKVSHALVLKSDGTVIARGSSRLGALDVPDNLTNVIQVSAGGDHSLALKNDGTVVAWGPKSPCNIGPIQCDIYYRGQADVPANLTNVIQVSAGLEHSLALKSDGTVVAWGDDEYGQTWSRNLT